MVNQTPVEAAGLDWGMMIVFPIWPSYVLQQIQARKSSRAVVGLGLGVGAAYLLWGNPMTMLQSGDVASIALLYATIGVGVVVGTQVSDSIESAQ